MSRCAIIVFKNGSAEHGAEFENSWGGAAFIWSMMFDKYVKDPDIPYDSWLVKGRDKPLWALASRADLPMFERAVLSSTYDGAIVSREHFEEFYKHIREFDARFTQADSWSHLKSWAEFIENCDSDVEAIGFYGTSICPNPWMDYNEDTDESVPYDLATGDKHWEIYEELAEEVEAGQ